MSANGWQRQNNNTPKTTPTKQRTPQQNNPQHNPSAARKERRIMAFRPMNSTGTHSRTSFKSIAASWLVVRIAANDKGSATNLHRWSQGVQYFVLHHITPRGNSLGCGCQKLGTPNVEPWQMETWTQTCGPYPGKSILTHPHSNFAQQVMFTNPFKHKYREPCASAAIREKFVPQKSAPRRKSAPRLWMFSTSLHFSPALTVICPKDPQIQGLPFGATMKHVPTRRKYKVQRSSDVQRLPKGISESSNIARLLDKPSSRICLSTASLQASRAKVQSFWRTIQGPEHLVGQFARFRFLAKVTCVPWSKYPYMAYAHDSLNGSQGFISELGLGATKLLPQVQQGHELSSFEVGLNGNQREHLLGFPCFLF